MITLVCTRRRWLGLPAWPAYACSALIAGSFLATPLVVDAAPGDLVGQFHHSTWSARAGAPPDIWALAQGDDGYMWLGTGGGLFRFDGVQFTKFVGANATPVSTNIIALNTLPNGDLWAGFYLGGATRVHGGVVTQFGEPQGFPHGWAFTFTQTSDGAIWAATDGGLTRYAGDHWETIGTSWNYPTREAGWALTDAEGTLWVADGTSLVFLLEGSRHFQDTHIAVGHGAILSIDRRGTLWVSDKTTGLRALPGVTASHPSLSMPAPARANKPLFSNRILFDRSGHLWGTDPGTGGAYYIASPSNLADGRSLQAEDVTTVYTKQTGLTSDMAVPLLQDHEGNVWVGTNFGLDSFQPNSVATMPGIDLTPGSRFSVAVDTRGDAWVSNAGNLSKAEHPFDAAPIRVPVQGDVASGDNGEVWLIGSHKLLRIVSGNVETVPLPSEVSSSTQGDALTVTAFAPDGTGGVWAAFAAYGVYHWDHGAWTAWPRGHLGVAPTAIARDERLWFGFKDNRIVMDDGADVHAYSAAEGLNVGTVGSINLQSHRVLVGGEHGIARFVDGRFQSISVLGTQHVSGVSGISNDHASVWLNTDQGVLRIGHLELDKAFASSNYRPAYRLFDYRDGLPGIATQVRPISTASVDRDGRVWLETSQGIASIDPARLRTNTIAPPVAILAINANGINYGAKGPVELPRRTSNLDIAFTAMSFSAPERVRFRYRLDGVDTQWQEAGTRRSASYTNLVPSAYTLHVIAANEDGVWNERGASISFSIPPLIYETISFKIFCGVAGLLLLIVVFGLRMRYVAERMRNRLEDRHAERDRIARELHDTLLQSVQGLILNFQAIAEQIPAGQPTRIQIDEALDVADEVLIEGRERVRDLRTTAVEIRDLPSAFARIAHDFTLAGHGSFRVIVEGPARALDPMIREETYRIGKEALANAFRHANADAIEVEINYDLGQFRVRVRDNGCGISEAIIAHGGKPGHWGLTGMRERADRMGGTLVMWARPGSGTEIELKIPASLAYVGAASSYLSVIRRLLSGGR